MRKKVINSREFPSAEVAVVEMRYSEVQTRLRSYDSDITKLRGQAYDGAGNMAGRIRGTAALITAQYPLALYIHCASHSLNLAVVKSLQVTSVRNMMGIVECGHSRQSVCFLCCTSKATKSTGKVHSRDPNLRQLPQN